MSKIGYIGFENSCVEVQVATTYEERVMGLMYRSSLPEHGGMLFIFNEESVHKIWMKNMLISLDIIWLNSKGVIIDIDKNVQPCKGSCQTFESFSKFALEVNAGYTDRYNINIGDDAKMIL